MSILEAFERLKDNPSGHTYTATGIQARDNVYLGINLAGQPCLLVRAEGRSASPPLRAAKVSLRPGQEISVALDNTTTSRGFFHMLSCESSERIEIDNFLILIEAFLAHCPQQGIDEDSIVSFFRTMLRLFLVERARDVDAERQGLWGELFVMRYTKGFRFWAPFWHNEVTRSFDFSAPSKRVEVKTAIGRQRLHHFSHRQIYALEGEKILIVSLLVRPEDAGLSLRDLIDECRAALRDSLHFLKIERAVRHAGMEDASETGPIYDASEAEKQLAWFRSADAPHFKMPEPAGVSETRYKVDLSAASCLSSQDVDAWLSTWPPNAS